MNWRSECNNLLILFIQSLQSRNWLLSSLGDRNCKEKTNSGTSRNLQIILKSINMLLYYPRINLSIMELFLKINHWASLQQIIECHVPPPPHHPLVTSQPQPKEKVERALLLQTFPLSPMSLFFMWPRTNKFLHPRWFPAHSPAYLHGWRFKINF